MPDSDSTTTQLHTTTQIDPATGEITRAAPYQLLPLLDDDRYQQLKADIAARGVLVPVEYDDQGNILDGHHRVRAWQELTAEGMKMPSYPRVERHFKDEQAKRLHVRALNVLRRDLTKEQRNDQIVAMRQEGASYRQIADAIGVSDVTALNVVKTATAKNLAVELPQTIKGKDGKRRAAKKPETPPSLFKVDAALTTKEVRRREKADERQRQRDEISQSAPQIELPERVILHSGAFQIALANIPDNSVDLIFTDPPYDEESIPLYGDLADLGARILKPGGSLICYVGHYAIPRIMPLMTDYLRYWWLMAVRHSGGNARLTGKNVYVGWKPLLWFVKGGRATTDYVSDFVQSKFEGQDLHDWQQSTVEADYYIRQLSPENGVVVDPFAGSGTTLLAALAAGRYAIGAEKDEERANVARGRLSAWAA
jgi:ParB-like chromosome segregation protein Spo0J